jgi:hypothetical protein
MVAHVWCWYRGLAGRERGLATAFLAIIVGTLPCYAFGVALLFAAPIPSRAAAPSPPTLAPPTVTPAPPPTAIRPTRPAPAAAGPVPAAKPEHEREAPGRGPRGNARGHDR